MIDLHLDLETKSACNLKKAGTYKYALDPTTDVWCACFSFGDEDEIGIWWAGDPVPKRVANHVKSGGRIIAHYATFERLLWWYVLTPKYGWPKPEIEQFVCSAAQCRTNGWPGALEMAARFGELPFRKDMSGHTLMMRYCRPRNIEDNGTIVWWDDPDELFQLGEYCKHDVRTERGIMASTRPMTEHELQIYWATEHLNDRGVRFDYALADKAVTEISAAKLDASFALIALTDGAVTKHTQVERILDWCKTQGVDLPNLNAATVKYVVDDPETPPEVAEVLEIRRTHGKAAVSKFQAMLNRGIDDYLYGLLIYYGAGQTGRFSSSGLQIHNLIRETAPEAIPVFMRYGLDGLDILGDPVHILARMVRPALIPDDGNTFLIGDWNAIEARVLPWLAHGCGINVTRYLNAWRNNEPVYEMQAGAIYHKPYAHVTGSERQVGKVAILACGYQGGEGAVKTMGRSYGIKFSSEEAEDIKSAWRAANPWAKTFWYMLEDAALKAVSTGKIVDLGALQFFFDGNHLWLRLPSGRLICYPFAEIRDGKFDTPQVCYKRGNKKPKKDETEWPRTYLYGGLIAENVTQGTARDLLVDCILRIEDANDLDWLLRVDIHDEVVVEVDKDAAPTYSAILQQEMERAPEWAEGLPLKAEIVTNERYGK